MTNPCDCCPFRNDDKRLVVSVERLFEFSKHPFVCHKTAEYDEGGEGGFVDNGRTSQHCAGALIFHEHGGGDAHLMMAMARRAGMYDPSKLNMDAPVFQSWEEVEESQPEWAE